MQSRLHVAFGCAIADLVLSGTLYFVDRADGRVFSNGDTSFDVLIGAAAAIGAYGLSVTATETPVTARSVLRVMNTSMRCSTAGTTSQAVKSGRRDVKKVCEFVQTVSASSHSAA